MRALIVTADDFCAAPEINEAVERAHLDGILTALLDARRVVREAAAARPVR